MPDHVPPVGVKPVNALFVEPLQILTSFPAFTAGIGFTVIALTSVPLQVFTSVTVTV